MTYNFRYNFTRDILNSGKDLFLIDLQACLVHRSIELEAFEWIQSTQYNIIHSSFWESDIRPSTLETFERGGPIYMDDRNALLEFKLRFPDVILSIRIAQMYPGDNMVQWIPYE
jgi:hypothetical protein